jgi:flagellar hook-basal body complex protein FliE
MSVSPIAAVGAGVDPSQLAAMYQQQALGSTGVGTDPTTDITSAAGQAAAETRGASFGDLVGHGLQQVENLDNTASTKAVQAATGDLSSVHDYVIAADQAQIAVELTTTLRDKALDAFNEIMRMSL